VESAGKKSRNFRYGVSEALQMVLYKLDLRSFYLLSFWKSRKLVEYLWIHV